LAAEALLNDVRSMRRTIGIDLGTTNSAGVVLKNGKMRMVPSAEGPTPHGKMFPSIVAFKPNGEILVGKKAKQYSHIHPERVVRWIKRKMGTDYTMNIDGATYTSQEISALILRKIKRDAEAFLGEEIDRAVITAPAYFNNNQRNATKEAGELAGFAVLRIISEPTAASLAYGLNREDEDMKVAVFDLGAGTFDVTILQMSHGVFNILSTSGDTALGGKDMDDAILDHLIAEIKRKYSVDVTRDPSNLTILRDAGEDAKIRLSRSQRALIDPCLAVGGRTLRPRLILTRGRVERLIHDVVAKLEEPMRCALDDSELTVKDIDRLVLVGGPTMMPVIRRRFREFFGIEPEEGIDPMGIVSTGAFIQASVLDGEIKDLLLLDVTPLSLGIETTGGVFTRLIPRNTTIPTEAQQVFATEEDGQTSMMIHVLQGEREMARGNTSLGLFKIDGIPPAPRFEQEVEVTFHIDANGILNVSAEALETGEQTSITIKGATELSENDLARMIIDATKYDIQDARNMEAVRVKKNAEAVLYGAREAIQRIKGRLTEDEERKYIQALDRLELSLLKGNMGRIRRHTADLTKLVEALTSKARKIDRTRLLVSSILGRHGDASEGEINLIEASAKRIEAVSYKEIDREMRRLREALTLLEADGRGG